MREATRADLPKGREAQCPICWRMFNSDTSCELHKPYRMPKTAECKEPGTVGLEAFEKRGAAVWYPRGTGPRSQPGGGGSAEARVGLS
jgi:hypothetical protein